jgi:hypothetical protein
MINPRQEKYLGDIADLRIGMHVTQKGLDALNEPPKRPGAEVTLCLAGYQEITIERGIADNENSRFLYIGDTFVSMNPDEWEQFKDLVNGA